MTEKTAEEMNTLIDLDFELALLIGKPVVWNAQRIIDNEPTRGWVMTQSKTKEECQAKIDSWSQKPGMSDFVYEPQGIPDRNWSPSTNLMHMAEVEHEVLRIRKTKNYARTLIKKLDMNHKWIDDGFMIATAPALLRAQAAREVLGRYGHNPDIAAPVYDKEIPDYADVMAKEDFITQVSDNGFFTEDDGTGYPAKDGKMAENQFVFPLSRIPDDATHIAWFNK